MKKNIISVETTPNLQLYGEKIIELTNDFMSKSTCEGIELYAQKKEDGLFSTVISMHEYNEKNPMKRINDYSMFNLDFDTLLASTNEMYKIIGSKMDPASIINRFYSGCVSIDFQMFGEWKILITGLTNEQLEIMKVSLNSIKEELLTKKKTR